MTHDTVSPAATAPQQTPINLGNLKAMRSQFTRLLMTYQFGIDEVMTKISILRDEFEHIHAYNPIEHINSRLKTPESILDKAARKGIELTAESLTANIRDVAGVRIVCSFVSDIYRVRDMIVRQGDLTVLDERDYIDHSKPTGYRSLHLIVQVPVFLSDRVVDVAVEIQLRTIAMDFWASLEHKIYYKYKRQVPARLRQELTDAAATAAELDSVMERLHHEVRELAEDADDDEAEDALSQLFGTMTLERLQGFAREIASGS